MPGPSFFDRVRETSATTGTGTLTLAGAVTGFRSFSAVGDGARTYYSIEAPDGGWEVGIGTYTSSGTTLSRDTVLASSNAGSLVSLAAGTKQVFLPAPAEAFTPLAGENALINGGFPFFQRTAPGTATARSDDTYGPDRWVILTQTAAVNIERSTGDTAPHALKMTQNQASAQRMGTLQIVEGINSRPARGQTVRLQFKAKCSTTTTLRWAVLEWTGTRDSVTSDVVLSWTSGTYTANNFFLAANLTVPTNSVQSKSVTTSWTSCETVCTISSGCENLIAFVWTESTAAQNVTVELTECMLTIGAQERTWRQRPVDQEANLCQRYYEKGYDWDVAPGTAAPTSEPGMVSVFIPVALSTGGIFYTYPFKVTKRGTPTVTIYSPTTGASGKLRNVNAAADRTASANYLGQAAFTLTHDDATTSNDQAQLIAQFTAESEL